MKGSERFRHEQRAARDAAKAQKLFCAPESETLGLVEKEPTPAGSYVVVRDYPSDSEFVSMNVDDASRLRRGGGAVRKAESREVQDAVTIMKSLQRTRVSIRRRILALGADRMLTLTVRRNITSLDEGWSLFKRFCAAMRKRWPDRWAYVCVPEFQTRGAVHFHVAIKGYYPVDVVRPIWLKVVGEVDGKTGGNIDITSPRGGRGARAIAAYLTNYMTKDSSGDVPLNRRRFSAGGDIPDAEVTRGYVAPGFPIHRMVRDHFWTEHSKPVAVEYSPEGGYLTYYAT